MAIRFTGGITRRRMLAGLGTATSGLAAAALLGCSSKKGATGPSTSSGGAAGAGNGAPAVKRAPGFDPKIGEVAVNEKRMVPGGTFRRAYTGTYVEFDPAKTVGYTDHQVMNDRLFYANGFTMELTPDLLTSYELVDKQGLQMVFKIRPGVKTFNKPPVNGRIFTAKDVAYSIMRQAGKVNPTEGAKYLRAQQYVGLDKAEAVDDITVKLTFSKPNGPFLRVLSDPRAQMMPVEQDDIGYKDPLKFVGTGPFIETAYVEGARQTYKANPDYYRKFEEGGRPGVDTIEDLVIADRASTLAAYLSNQIHYLPAVQPQEEAQIKGAAKDSQWYLSPGPTWDLFSVNLLLPQFQDPRVLQAFNLGIDRVGIAEPLGRGWTYGAVTNSMFPEAWKSDEVAKLPGRNAATRQQDVAKAQQLMDAAGFKEGNGMSFTFEYSTTPSDTQIRLKDQFSKLFPKADVKIAGTAGDGVASQNKLVKGEYTARASNHTSVPDVVLDLRTYYHSTSVTGGRNYARYIRPWVDEALDKLLVAQTFDERKALVRPLIERIESEGPPIMILRHPPDNYVVHGNFAGWDLTTGPWAYPQYPVALRWIWQTEA